MAQQCDKADGGAHRQRHIGKQHADQLTQRDLKKAELAKAQIAKAHAEKAEASSRGKLEEWQSRWEGVMQSIHLANEASPEEASARIEQFTRFVELGSSTHLVKELRLDGVTSKAWTTQDGRTRCGVPIDKSLIYKVLNNRAYRGEIAHKGAWYQGEHPPIISQALWDDAHAILETNGRVRANITRATTEFLLKGIVFGEDGRALSPSQSTKKSGRRYRYYVHQREVKEFAGASGLPRIVAADLESAVLEQLRGLMRAPALLTDAIAQAKRCDATLDEAKVTVAMNRLDAIWAQMFPAEQTRMIKLMVEKVIISTKQLEVRLRANGMERLILEMRPDAAVAA